MTIRHHTHLIDGKDVTVGYEIRINTCVLTHFPRDFEGAFEIPSKVRLDGEDRIVAGIADNAFMGCGKLTKLVIPDTVLFIG